MQKSTKKKRKMARGFKHAKDPHGVGAKVYNRALKKKWPHPHPDKVFIGMKLKGGHPAEGEIPCPIHEYPRYFTVHLGDARGRRLRPDGSVASGGKKVPTQATYREAVVVVCKHFGISPENWELPPSKDPPMPGVRGPDDTSDPKGQIRRIVAAAERSIMEVTRINEAVQELQGRKGKHLLEAQVALDLLDAAGLNISQLRAGLAEAT